MPQSFVGWTDAAPERYVMELPMAPPVLLTCSPEDCRAVFTEREGALLFGEGLRRFAPHEAMFGHDAIAALDGEDHTRFRRRLTAAFHGDAKRMHHRADVYPEPRGFRPERFLESRPGTYTWIPFGGGVHRCIGAGFALTEARLILQTMLRHVSFAREDSAGEPSQRRTLITMPRRRATVTLVPTRA